MNEEIERELISFKAEIKNKFLNSAMNQGYRFPRKKEQEPCVVKEAKVSKEGEKRHRRNHTLNFSGGTTFQSNSGISNRELSQKLSLKLNQPTKSR